MADETDTAWYWCLHHHRAEHSGDCRAERQLGPYPSAEAAERWRERVEQRNQRWDDEDERWRGP
jgi:hypothetical protein